jgi:hypothetical protein
MKNYILPMLGIGSLLAASTLNAYSDELKADAKEVHPYSITKKVVGDKLLRRLYIFPHYLLRSREDLPDQNGDDTTRVTIGNNVGIVRIIDPVEIEKFSELFALDVEFSFSPIEGLPNAIYRNSVVFVSASDSPALEWDLFRINSVWWFCTKWGKGEKDFKYTTAMKCGPRMGQYLDGLFAEAKK